MFSETGLVDMYSFSEASEKHRHRRTNDMSLASGVASVRVSLSTRRRLILEAAWGPGERLPREERDLIMVLAHHDEPRHFGTVADEETTIVRPDTQRVIRQSKSPS